MKIIIEEIHIDPNQVLKFLGYGTKKPAPIILKKIDEEIKGIDELLKPIIFIKEFKIDSKDNGKITFGDKYIIDSEYAFQELKDCNKLYISLYSLGNVIEERIQIYSASSEMIRGMILDKIGVVALDNMKQQIRSEIEGKVAPLEITTEIFPAQKDFPNSFQSKIFDMFEYGNTEITISKSHQLHPIKTVGVIFGIGNKKQEFDMCDRCDNKCC